MKLYESCRHLFVIYTRSITKLFHAEVGYNRGQNTYRCRSCNIALVVPFIINKNIPFMTNGVNRAVCRVLEPSKIGFTYILFLFETWNTHKRSKMKGANASRRSRRTRSRQNRGPDTFSRPAQYHFTKIWVISHDKATIWTLLNELLNTRRLCDMVCLKLYLFLFIAVN